MPRTPKREGASAAEVPVRTVAYPARRKNIPPAGLEAQGMVRDEPTVQLRYNAHLPPVLRSASDAEAADRLPELLAAARLRALTDDEAATLGMAVRQHQPWLEWSGKREKSAFEVDPVPLHMHERVATEAILQVLAREDVNRDLFADPQHDYAQAVQFYRHDVDWANRMILGDSAQVMASLVFAAFGFDAAAQEAVEDASHPKLRLHMALIRFDVKMGDDLLKDQTTSQLFTVFSAPRMKEPERQQDGQFVVEVEGMDVYDPASGAVSPTDSRQIAAWFLDTTTTAAPSASARRSSQTAPNGTSWRAYSAPTAWWSAMPSGS